MALSKDIQVLDAHTGTDLPKIQGKPDQIKIGQGRTGLGKPDLLISQCSLIDVAILQVHVHVQMLDAYNITNL